MELYIEPIRLQRNAVNGKFLKGNEPFNKGKKWNDYLSVEMQNKCREQLSKGRKGRKGRKDIGGCNKKAVVAIKNGEFYGYFESSADAGRRMNLCARNINSVAHNKRGKCGGYEFYFESDFDKWNERIAI